MTLGEQFDREDRLSSVGGRSSIWFQHVMDQLRDGQWHDRDEVIAQAAKTVPPGRAWRVVEARRIQQLRRRMRDKGMSEEEIENWITSHDLTRSDDQSEHNRAITAGQRQLVNDHINRTTRIEKQTVDGRRMIRRVPMTDAQMRKFGYYPQKGGEAGPTD